MLTPTGLTEIWSEVHGLSRWFGSGFDVPIDGGGLLRAGRYEQVGADDLGCTLITFDPDTGEPLAFTSHLMVNVSDHSFLGVYHFPDEAAVVLFGVSTPSTATAHRVYAQRVEYDLATCTLTPGPLATWSPNPSSSNTKREYAADVPSSTVVNVLAWGSFNLTSCTLDLSTGSVGTPTNHSIATLFGGGRDRISVGGGGRNFDGVALIAAYVNASGVTTAHTFRLPFSGSPGSATDTSLGRLTALGTPAAGPGAASLIPSASFDFGASGDYLMSASSFAATPAADVRTDATVHNSALAWDHQHASNLLVFNREGPTVAVSNLLRAREYEPVSGDEVAAWEYPGVWTDYDDSGLLTVNRRFFWAYDEPSETFMVFEDPTWVPPPPEPGTTRFWLGKVGFRA